MGCVHAREGLYSASDTVYRKLLVVKTVIKQSDDRDQVKCLKPNDWSSNDLPFQVDWCNSYRNDQSELRIYEMWNEHEMKVRKTIKIR